MNELYRNMDYKFDTQYFAITDSSILLLRNRYAYREIKTQEISKIELTKGTDLKRPKMSVIFGLLLIMASVFLVANFSGFKASDMTGGRAASRSFGSIIVMEVFFFSLGAYSIYKALPLHSILKLSLISGETESLTIQEVIKNKKTAALLESLKQIGADKMIIIDRRIQQG